MLSRRRRSDGTPTAPPLGPIQFRLEPAEEDITTDTGQHATGRGYHICDPHTGDPLGEDDFFFRIGGGIVCDVADTASHGESLQDAAFRPGRTLRLVRGDGNGIDVTDLTGQLVVGRLSDDVADSVAFYGMEAYQAALSLWEWRGEDGARFGLRLLLAPGWTVQNLPAEQEPSSTP